MGRGEEAEKFCVPLAALPSDNHSALLAVSGHSYCPACETVVSWTEDLGRRLKRQCFQLSLFPRAWLCLRLTAGEKLKQGWDRLLKRLLLLSDPDATYLCN